MFAQIQLLHVMLLTNVTFSVVEIPHFEHFNLYSLSVNSAFGGGDLHSVLAWQMKSTTGQVIKVCIFIPYCSAPASELKHVLAIAACSTNCQHLYCSVFNLEHVACKTPICCYTYLCKICFCPRTGSTLCQHNMPVVSF